MRGYNYCSSFSERRKLIYEIYLCKYRATYRFCLKHALVCRLVSSSRYFLAVFREIYSGLEVEVFV